MWLEVEVSQLKYLRLLRVKTMVFKKNLSRLFLEKNIKKIFEEIEFQNSIHD